MIKNIAKIVIIMIIMVLCVFALGSSRWVDAEEEQESKKPKPGVKKEATRNIVKVPEDDFKKEDIVKMPGDGNCFYHAIVYGLQKLNLYTGDNNQLRQDTKQFVIKNKNNFNFENFYDESDEKPAENIDEYIEVMGNDKHWATDIEFRAIGMMFPHCQFLIYKCDRNSNNITRVHNGNLDETKYAVRLYYYPGIHYNALPPSFPTDVQKVS